MTTIILQLWVYKYFFDKNKQKHAFICALYQSCLEKFKKRKGIID
jgi:hypothetical protein